MNKEIRYWIPLLCLGLLFCFNRPVFAQEEIPTPSDDEVNAVAGKLYCPVCENIPLDVCGTQACIQWRELIREQLAQGQTSDEIQQFFVERYGEQVLAEPPMSGFSGMLYWLPLFMLLLSLGLLIRILRRRRLKMVIPATESTSEIAAYIDRMEDELKTYQDK